MKTEKELLEKLNHIKSDERLTYESATVFGNAPLALIQTSMEAQIHCIEWMLGLPYSKFPLPKTKTKTP